MVKRGCKNVSNSAICSIIRSRPKRICRYGSRASLDVKSSFVQKKIWLFEGFNQNDYPSKFKRGSRRYYKCMKRILPHRASYKCSACKQICHLKCAIKPENRPTSEKIAEDIDADEVNTSNMDGDDVDFDVMKTEDRAEYGIVQKCHRETRNAARLRKQLLENNINESNETKQSDLNTSIQSQAKQKFSSMKHNIVKRCKSIKKKVQKKKKETDYQVDDNNNSADNDLVNISMNRAAEEREAWLQSPIRTRLRSRIAELEEQSRLSLNKMKDESPQQASNITERRKKDYSKYQTGRTRVRRFLHDYDLTVKQILDRLDIVEEKIKHLQTAIPVEISKWKTLQDKYRKESLAHIDSAQFSSIESDIPLTNETCLKHLEAENNLPSLSSGTASDEVYLVKDKSTSSHEFIEQTYAPDRKLNRQEAVDADFPEDSLPSGLPLHLRTDLSAECIDHQTSTPVTERDLTYLKHSNRSHSIKHTSVTNIKLDTSGGMHKPETHKQDFETDPVMSQIKVLSPEQIGVKRFLQRRISSPSHQNQSTDRSSLYGASPIASSSFRQGDDWMNGFQTSPFSFTFRNDYVDHSKASFTKVMDDSEVEFPKQNGSNQNCSSNLSFTFRNDSQLIPAEDNEDLPGFTRNHSFHPVSIHQEYRQMNQIPTTLQQGENVLHYKDESFNREQYNYIEKQEERQEKMSRMVHIIEADVHERRESSMLTDTDRTSLTNVTQGTGDFFNSFDERPNKSRWAYKDVFMFRGTECSNYVGRQSKSPEKVDERGDNHHKPPKPNKNKTSTDRNFITEAEEKLKSFQLRRSLSHGENVTVGVCVLQKRCHSDNRLADRDVLKTGKFVGEEASENHLIDIDGTENKSIVPDNQHETGENTLLEFEKMEILCESEALKYTEKPSEIHKIEPEISIETERLAGRSISRTSSMESKCSAKYHFLHDKGMIKIESPSLTLVCSSPGPTRKEMPNHRLYEEDSIDLAETGSESDIEEIYIDDSFKLHSVPAGPISTDIESDITNNGDAMSEIEEDSDSRTIAEQQLLDEYLRTEDDRQETWDNVMKWMHKEQSHTEGEELQEELKKMIKQERRLDGQKSGYLDKIEPEMGEENIALCKNPNDFVAFSDYNPDDSIYYSFQAQSEDQREQCRRDSLVYENRDIDRDDMENCEDGATDSPQSSSLMYTIVNGTVKDVEYLLNSDRTISEAEIKDGLIWALTNKNLPITLLLLEDICKLICAAEEGTYVDVYPGYSEKDPWNPVFIVLSKTHPTVVWDRFMDLPVYRRKFDTVSREIDLIEHNDIVKSKTITEEEQRMIIEAIKTINLYKRHSKITMVTGSAIRSKKEGKEFVSETCIAIHCILKGFIPYGEEPFPREINGIPTDVREGVFDYCQNKNLLMQSNIIKTHDEEIADLMPDTNNNKIPPDNLGEINRQPGKLKIPQAFLGHIRDDRGPFTKGPVAKTTNVTTSTYNCVEHMNGHAVKETMEVFCDSENKSEEPVDIIMNKKTEDIDV